MTEKSLSIAIATIQDARNPRSWSGTVYHLAEALRAQGADLDYVGPMETGPLWAEKAVARLRRKLGLSKTVPVRTNHAARIFARQIERAVASRRPDIVFSPAGSVPIAGLEPGLPAVYSSDATAALMRGYYPSYSAQSRRALRRADQLEQRAIARADLLLYPTNWAAASAVSDYGADPCKISVVPYGANLAAPERAAALAERPPGPLKLVFVGVNWDRKGGDIAVAALDALLARGIEAQLTVIGCIPPDRFRRPQITVIPFLDKNDPEQGKTLAAQYLGADLLLLPTRQECYGIVFCEAAAHGVPSITTATGGVTDVVREGVTGYTLPPEAGGSDFADVIENALASPGGLGGLRRTARDDYETRLNWTTWAEKSCSLMRDMLRRRR